MKIHLHAVANMDTEDMNEILSIYTNTDYVEGDVRCTADGILVMSHNKYWFGYEIDKHSYIFLNNIHFLPTFDRLIQNIQKNISLNIEIKTDGELFYIYKNHIILELCHQLSKISSKNSSIIQCFDLNVLNDVSYFLSFFNFPCYLSYLIEDYNIYYKILKNNPNITSFVTIISPHIELIGNNDIEKIKGFGYQVVPWYNKNYSSEKSKLFHKLDGLIFDV